MKITVLEDLLAELHALDGTDLEVKLSLDTRTFLNLKHQLNKEFSTFRVVERDYADLKSDLADITVHTAFGQLTIERRMSNKEVKEQEEILLRRQRRMFGEPKGLTMPRSYLENRFIKSQNNEYYAKIKRLEGEDE